MLIKQLLGESKKDSTTLACFSPQVMALTFALEMLLLMYVLVKRGIRSMPLRLISFILLFLALFQLAEYGVCEGLGFLSDEAWAKIGFVSITLLPALGVHLVQTLRKDKKKVGTIVSYLMAGLFSILFVFMNGFEAIGCGDNYAIFKLKPGIGGGYFVYYYALLLFATNLALVAYKRTANKKLQHAYMAISLGYASFVVPASVIHLLFAEKTDGGLPSIMCGFALLFAFVLALYVAPRVEQIDKD